MFEAVQAQDYEKVYQDLLTRIGQVDLSWRAVALGGTLDNGELVLPSLGRLYHCSAAGIRQSDGTDPHLTIRIVLARYIIQGGTAALHGHWVSYREFKDAAFFMSFFQQSVEEPLALAFAGRLEDLRICSRILGGEEDPGLPGGDLRLRFPALPNVPLALIFYDADEELPASARILYDAHSPFFLDLECLAVLGYILKERLVAELGSL
jgi:hypothetical protein